MVSGTVLSIWITGQGDSAVGYTPAFMAAAAGSIPVFPTCSFGKSGALYTLYSAWRSSWSSGSSELSDRLCS